MTLDSSLQGTWVLISYRSDDRMVTPDDRTEANLTIEGTLISGSMGLNMFTGQIEDVPIGPLATTRMAGPEELIRQEDILLGYMQDADEIQVIEDGMTLSRDGLLLMELERSEAGDPAPMS